MMAPIIAPGTPHTIKFHGMADSPPRIGRRGRHSGAVVPLRSARLSGQ
jgi:hypothetical protein